MDELKNGDVVELKSGGPRMTIDLIGHIGEPQTADCSWFEGGRRHTGKFPITSLKSYVEQEVQTIKNIH